MKFAFEKYFRILISFGDTDCLKFIELEPFERGTVSDVKLVAPEAQTDPIPSVSLHFYEQNLDQTKDQAF